LLTDGHSQSLEAGVRNPDRADRLSLNGGDTDIAYCIRQRTDRRQPIRRARSPEIELELKRGEPAELFKLARTIGDIVPAQLDVKSKSERGFDLVEKASIAPRSL
jgi:hypothetical protein